MRTHIVVPFKNPSRSKERLSDFLSASERRELSISLFRKTVGTLLSVSQDVSVITDSDEVQSMAQELGAGVILEENARGETEAVNLATRISLERGYDRQVVIPADLADLDAREVEELLAFELAAPSVVLVPAVGDDGTNAIMTAPPDAIPFRFGRASFAEYLLRAAELGATARVLRLKSFVLDIDTPEDLNAASLIAR